MSLYLVCSFFLIFFISHCPFLTLVPLFLIKFGIMLEIRIVSLNEKLTDRKRDGHRREITVYLSVFSKLEPAEEEHQLGHLQVIVFGSYERGKGFRLPIVKYSSVVCERHTIGYLWHEPYSTSPVAVVLVQCCQRRVVSEEAAIRIGAKRLLCCRCVLRKDSVLEPVSPHHRCLRASC